uniref:Uncharacterized protein n=1 Tax=Acrobeloides nanus TaxID=290746 RepID=A0A914C8E2_9BILA
MTFIVERIGVNFYDVKKSIESYILSGLFSKRIELFKDPKGIMFTARRLFSMSETIFTPSQSSICGISMEINKEYLLAGRTVNESMLMLVSVCDQFTEFGEPEPMNQCLVPLPEDRSRKSDIFAQLLEWERISEGLKEQLRRKSLEPCFNF